MYKKQENLYKPQTLCIKNGKIYTFKTDYVKKSRIFVHSKSTMLKNPETFSIFQKHTEKIGNFPHLAKTYRNINDFKEGLY